MKLGKKKEKEAKNRTKEKLGGYRLSTVEEGESDAEPLVIPPHLAVGKKKSVGASLGGSRTATTTGSEFDVDEEIEKIDQILHDSGYHTTIKDLLRGAALRNLDKKVTRHLRKKSRGLRADSFSLFSKSSRLSFTRGKEELVKNIATEVVTVHNMFGSSNEELLDSIEGWMMGLGYDDVYRRDSKKFRKMCTRIQDSYHNNPFHNWQHAYSVAQVATMFIEKAEIDTVLGLTSTEAVAFIIGALGHDIGHPGNDNNFQIQSETQIAALYNHESVLENLHASQLLEIITNDQTNIFEGFPAIEQLELHQLVIDIVLGTDMKFHEEHVQTLANTPDLSTMKGSQIKDKTLARNLLRALLHACDISGQCMDLHVAQRWEDRISTEMRRQAEEMRENGLEVPSYLMYLQEPQARAEIQLKFIEGWVSPLWKEVARVFPAMQGMHKNLDTVVKRYYEILVSQGEKNANKFADMCFSHEKGGHVGVPI